MSGTVVDTIELHDASALAAHLAAGRPLTGVRLQGVDLGGAEAALLATPDLRGLVVLGGTASPRLTQHLVRCGAVVFPVVPDCPVDVYRPRLYTPDELYAGLDRGYPETLDARAYAWSRDGSLTHDALTTALRALHDDAIGDALAEVVAGRRVVGVMGGHAVRRGTEAYADAARLAHALAQRGMVVVTGGGPGAMEGANLGALAPTAPALEEALRTMAVAPEWQEGVSAWASSGLTVRDALLAADVTGAELRSLGVPTWYYGHEPPNALAQQQAKYFSNALREDVLLALATDGLVVLPGAAGTVQEIFQLTTRLYYAQPGTVLPPLVLVGSDHWHHRLPVWALLQALGQGRSLGQAIHLVDDVHHAVELLVG